MTPPSLDWKSTMTPEEVSWCSSRILAKVRERGDMYADSFRAARKRKRTQVKRFKGCRTCCGSHEWVEADSSGDDFLLGYNHGH